MTKLIALLEGAGVRRAVVIDDVFDEVPRIDELDEDGWTVFFDDLSDDGHRFLSGLYPVYEETSPGELKQSQKFISLVWKNRDRLPTAARDALFNDYENTSVRERGELEELVARLQNLGLTCKPMGRNIPEETKEADLIVVDLFLGFQQSEEDIRRAIHRVNDLVRDRAEDPPLVVLMSRSSRLLEMKNDFRDRAGLLSSTFRVISKADLRSPGILERLLTRLASHYEDAKRVARFVHAWNAGLDHARRNFIRVLRRLDLSDLAQIQALLLEFEGQKPGEYLLDVADGVLRHEIEDDENTIDAALELNRIDLTRYPAPHLAGTSDLQELVYRMVFMHSDRLRLSTDGGRIQLQFGDLLRWRNEDRMGFCNDVSLVITPACDLVRRGAKRVALLAGRLESLEPEKWTYQGRPVRTAIVILSGEGRKWIRWNLKDVRTLTWRELDELLVEPEALARIGRLRELYAVEIQQMALADFGRMGRPANLPAAFPVEVSLFYVDNGLRVQALDVGGIDLATCYVGRDEQSRPIHRLVLTEQTCDRIESTLHGFDANQIHQSARSGLVAMKADSNFFDRFERGEVEVPPTEGGLKKILANGKLCAVTTRNDNLSEGTRVSGDCRKAAFIVKVSDV